jgi:FSR family fosmidomycin resistance protein-like MFS transporter
MSDLSIAPAGRDYRIIGLVSVAHAFSHFYQLVFPMLFIALQAEFGVSYLELGALTTTLMVSSGLAQTGAGFLVDRFGGRAVLLAGMGVFGGAFVLAGFASEFWMLYAAAALAGLGNSVFHPADYSILTAAISPARIGRAYSAHTFTGYLGWALTPPVTLGLEQAFGWRVTLMVLGAAGLAFLVVMLLNAHHLPADQADDAKGKEKSPVGGAVLFSTPVLLCFAYFLCLAFGLAVMQNFVPATMGALFGTPIAAAGSAVAGYMVGSAAGVVLGGVLIDRQFDPLRVVLLGLPAGAVCLALSGTVYYGPVWLIGIVALAGFCLGATTPSRDMLVRAAAPQGASGRVFGFVYSGLDAGAAIAPVMIGAMLDGQRADLVMWSAAAVQLVGMFTAFNIKRTAPA